MIEYYTVMEYSGPYGNTVEMKKKTLEKFRNRISVAIKDGDIFNKKFAALVSTRLPKTGRWWFTRFFEKRQHILVLDCDGQNEMIATASALRADGIKWIGVESSPGRYWFICEKVGLFRDLYSKMQAMPGNDTRYTDLVKNRKMFLLRAIRHKNSCPSFTIENEVKDPRVLQWYKEFKAIHEDEVISNRFMLHEALKNNKIPDVAADPNFKV